MIFDVYTLIAYRENGTDSCRGCIIAQSDSAHKTIITENIDKIALEFANLNFQDKYSEREVCGWEVTILMNGMCIMGYVDDDLYEDCLDLDRVKEITKIIKQKSAEYLAGMIAEHEEETRKKIEAMILQEQEKKLKKELEEYNRLKSKFGDS